MTSLPEIILGELSSTVQESQTIEQLTRPLLKLLELVTGLECTYLTHIDHTAGLQSVLIARNTKEMQIPEGLSVPWEDTLCKRALEEGRPFTEDASACWGDSEAARLLGIRTYVSTPIFLTDGELYGTLCAASQESLNISEQSRQTLILFGALIGNFIQREKLVEQLQEANRLLATKSYRDALTGLPNRRFIDDEIQRIFSIAQREHRLVYVTFIDLDDFKKINDTYGHSTGDDFLIEASKRLQSAIRAGDVLGRLGGDEFIILGLGSSLDNKASVNPQALEERLSHVLQGDYQLPNARFQYSGASFGSVLINPFDSLPQDAIQQADHAMYIAKKIRKKNS